MVRFFCPSVAIISVSFLLPRPQAIAQGSLATITVGGIEQVAGSTTDRGTVSLQINGVTESVPYGQFSTSGTVASALAATISKDCNFPVLAKAFGSSISFYPRNGTTSVASATLTSHSVSSANFPESSFLQLVQPVNVSGSSDTMMCSSQAGSSTLTSCSGSVAGFAVNQGLRIIGGGVDPTDTSAANPHPITPVSNLVPIVTQSLNNPGNPSPPSGPNTNCYIFAIVDPYLGITAPSQPACGPASQPDLSLDFAGMRNTVSLPSDYNSNAYSGSALWYVSRNGQPYQLLGVNNLLPFGGSGSLDDVGQAFTTPGTILPGATSTFASRGGWPTNVSVSDVASIAKHRDLFTVITGIDGNQISLRDPVSTPSSGFTVYHDDTEAIQAAIDAAILAGGGVIQLGEGTYNIAEPLFVDQSTLATGLPWVFTRDYAKSRIDEVFSYLDVSSTSSGHVHLEGAGSNTVLNTPPDNGGISQLLYIGAADRPDSIPNNILAMDNIAKGSTQMVVDGSNSSALSPGDDVFIFSGSYAINSVCQSDTTSSVADMCHYLELNTVNAVSSDGGATTLAYPASKNYGPDLYGSRWGIIKIAHVPHDVAVEHMTIDTYNRVSGVGLAIKLLFNDLTVNGYVAGGVFGGGYKQDVTVENSTWGIGDGGYGGSGEDEYDGFVNVSLLNNHVYGDCASHSAGPSQQCRIYATEGSSGFTLTNNQFYGVSFYTDETTNDTLSHNSFIDGILALGTGYHLTPWYDVGSYPDGNYLSYASSTDASVQNNTFQISSDIDAPFILLVGNFTNSSLVSGNMITFTGVNAVPAIIASSGSVSGNTVTMPNVSQGAMSVTGGNQDASDAIVLLPDQPFENGSPYGPPSSVTASDNTITAGSLYAGVYVPHLGFSYNLPICIQNNVYLGNNGGATLFTNPSQQPQYAIDNSSINFSCQ